MEIKYAFQLRSYGTVLMATITYENISNDRIVEPLQDIISDELNVPIVDEHRGNQSIVINLLEDTLIEHFHSGQMRNYDVSIVYTLMRGGGWKSVKMHLTSMAEHLKKLIFNNSNYSPSGDYKFHDGKVESIEYEQDEDDLDLWRANILFNCTVTEVFA